MNDYALLMRYMLLTFVVAAALLLPGKGLAVTQSPPKPVVGSGTITSRPSRCGAHRLPARV